MEPPVTTESRRRRQSAAPAAAAALQRPLEGRTPLSALEGSPARSPSASGWRPAAVAMAARCWLVDGGACQRAALSYWSRRGEEGGAGEAMEGGEASGGLLQQILSLRLVPRSGNGTAAYSNPLAAFSEMWYGVFLWALVSSLSFHVPAALLALFTLRRHKYGRFMSLGLLLMGIVGPITAGILTSTAPAALGKKHPGAAIAGVYRAAGKNMIPFEALILGVGQTFCVVVVSFLRILATL
nr:transmembrane protein 170A isoform X1 [Anas platyrhynchos]